MFSSQTIHFDSPILDGNGAIVERLACKAELVEITVGNHQLAFIRVPEGSFTMGSPDSEERARANERPSHDVHVPEFWIGRHTVTQAQWAASMGAGSVRCQPISKNPELPVVNVWLDEALIFCHRLSDLTGLAIRLPSEAEWEYACRAGTDTTYSFGATLTPEVASYGDGADGRLVASGSLDSPNQFGLNDMHGNVWEWCSDVWHEDYTGAPKDGSAWVTDGDASYCVQRGGSWRSPMSSARSAARVGDIARNDEDIVGLRLCFTEKF